MWSALLHLVLFMETIVTRAGVQAYSLTLTASYIIPLLICTICYLLTRTTGQFIKLTRYLPGTDRFIESRTYSSHPTKSSYNRSKPSPFMTRSRFWDKWVNDLGTFLKKRTNNQNLQYPWKKNAYKPWISGNKKVRFSTRNSTQNSNQNSSRILIDELDFFTFR